jgi:Golgi phosphoprotein 3 (GPP34)
MATSDRDQFATLGEDLLLLSVDPGTGKLKTSEKVPYGLMGSELIRLAARARVDIADDRIVVRSPGLTGDPQLDQALTSLAESRRPPRPRSWVGHPRRHIREEYLTRLVQAGALREDRSAVLGLRRYAVVATDRVTAARALLDVIARSAGQVPLTQAAFAGLAHAIGLDAYLYPGWPNRALRKRLAQIAQGKHTAPGGTVITSATSAAESAAASAASTAAIQAATSAAVSAATSAAIQAATDAAVSAAVSAAAAASVDAGAHHGAAAGGHH